MLEKFNKLISGELEYFEFESRRQHSNGSWVWVLDRGRVSERNDNGEPVRISGTSTDISKRKQADIAKKEFISTVSHELRTPLTSIKGSLGLLNAGVLDHKNDEAKSMIDLAYKNSERLLFLINDILDIEKMESGKLDCDMKELNIHTLINDAIEANQGYADKHDVALSYAHSPEDLSIRGDKNRLIQVLSNFMSNAIKFSPTGGKVELFVTPENDFVRIEVKDQGIGIPEGSYETLFDKFTQVDSSDTRKVGGTGLGLSISKGIVEEHGGTIGVESIVGEGSMFFFTLPKHS